MFEKQQGLFLFAEGRGTTYSAIEMANVSQIVASVRRPMYFAVPNVIGATPAASITNKMLSRHSSSSNWLKIDCYIAILCI